MVKLKRLKSFLSLWLLGFWLIVFLGFGIFPAAKATTNSSTTLIPTLDWQQAKLPDWSQITFESLPPISSSGSFQAPEEVISQLDYDPSRQWIAGQTPDQFLKLGDFQSSFKLQNFDLSKIAQIVGLDLNNITLERVGIMNFQNL
ncbi:hypothetical protein [Floridanema evergladense]|uniref:Uncharacterized protein n=1 Tax=Floridaenema evergladense BLCC-F167 TaxID=3153639 RepID=A0ABV4WSE1_9CYAN